jgi:hypothetical protein
MTRNIGICYGQTIAGKETEATVVYIIQVTVTYLLSLRVCIEIWLMLVEVVA